MNDMQLGFQLMGYGLLGVFSVLIIFMIVIKLLTVIFPAEKESKDQ
ncbi:MAG: OadG family protein [Oscillospiraceae bacterium]|jgi:Na+-transporting methylmalonyl-CoA/oxaloacetate decarboxylase gamma subunit|nr:OadG family protein [Oscillospiraceae bacterium]